MLSTPDSYENPAVNKFFSSSKYVLGKKPQLSSGLLVFELLVFILSFFNQRSFISKHHHTIKYINQHRFCLINIPCQYPFA